MTTDISPMAAVKLLHDALQGVIRVADRQTDEFEAAREALRLTASIEQPTSEAVVETRKHNMQQCVDLVAQKRWTECVNCGVKPGMLRAKWPCPATPPAKEAILQAMVDQAEELGLYDDSVTVPAFDQAEFDALVEKGTKAWAGVELVDGHFPAGAPVDERAALIREALDIAFHLVSEEAHRIHETYKGYKPDRHAAIDADVATVIAARAAFQQQGLADKEALYNELIFAIHRKFPDESRHQTALWYIQRAERLETAAAKSASPKDTL